MNSRRIYPVLQPTSMPARPDCATRPFAGADGLFVLAFARENEDELELVGDDAEFPSAEQIEQLLCERNLIWEQVAVTGPHFEPFTMLACEGDTFASEVILAPALLKQAAERLRAHRIAVGVPRRGVAMVARADLPDEQLLAFAKQVAREYTFGEGRELSHRMLFWNARRRVWDGSYPRSDEVLARVRDESTAPSPELSARARYGRRRAAGTGGFEYVVEVKNTHAGELRELFKTVLMNVCDSAAKHGAWNAQLFVRFDPQTVPCTAELAAEIERVIAELLNQRATFEAMAGTTTPIQIRVGWA
jgi:hypothetical protein